MTEAAQQHRIENAERELKAFRAQLTAFAPETLEYRHTADRIRNLESDLLRYRSGKLTARD
jgi:hypothetical protein